jgi:hypothetical protein
MLFFSVFIVILSNTYISTTFTVSPASMSGHGILDHPFLISFRERTARHNVCEMSADKYLCEG